ncbi:MAG: NAD(+)/NADH kinase [Phycisphaerales bacterium]
MPRAVVLITNHQKPKSLMVLDEVRTLIETHGQLVAEVESRSDDPLPNPDEVDLVIALGGDGTILSAAHKCLKLRSPLLGINTGKVGFMAGYEFDSFRLNASQLLGDGDLHIHPVTPLHGIVRSHDGQLRHAAFALNEYVVTAGPPFRMITLDLSVDEQPGPTVSGDGLIVSTPLGSTAYNVSAGGPILAPGVQAMIITPIAAHSLSFRPIVIRSDSKVHIQLSSVNAIESSGTTLIIDGHMSHRLDEGDVLEVGSANEQIEFVLDPSVSYWQTLIKKMHWASVPKSPHS